MILHSHCQHTLFYTGETPGLSVEKTTPWHCFWKTTTKPNPLIPLEKAILNGKQSYAHFHTHMADSDLSYASTNWNAYYNMVKFAGDLAQILWFPSMYKVAPYYTDRWITDSRDDIHHITGKNRSWIKSYYFKRFIYLVSCLFIYLCRASFPLMVSPLWC